MNRAMEISTADHARISAAVAAAEANSDGEIATMMAHISDDYGDWALFLAVTLSFAKLAAIAVWVDTFDAALIAMSGGWRQGFGSGELIAAALLVQMATFALAWILLCWMPLRLALTPRHLKRARVRKAAMRAFRIGIEARTRASTGVLIYLSLAERCAEIIADAAITERVGVSEWGEAMAILIGHVRADRPADGIIGAVDRAGSLIARHFPRSADDTNEMPDRLIEL